MQILWTLAQCAARCALRLPARAALCALPLLLLALAPGTAQAQAQAYQLQPGDILRVEVIEDPTLNRDVLISPDGRFAVPLAGSILAAGRSVEQVQALLTDALASSFAARPTVFVGLQSVAPEDPLEEELEEPEPYAIYVLGEVNSPGRIDVEPGTDILQLFALVGGFTDFAAVKRIQLRRLNDHGSEEIYALNYNRIEDGLSPYGRALLRDGDTFIVPVRRLFE